MANSTQTSTSDGTLALLTLGINYLDRSEISVFFDNLPSTTWSWVGVTDKKIQFSPPVPNGVEVLVRRTTDSSKLRHEFSRGAAFGAPTLDEALSQVLHISQEAQEGNLSGDFYDNINLHGNRIEFLGDGIAPTDAVTVQQAASLVAPGVAAADASAEAAAASAAAAAISAGSASSSATAAEGWAAQAQASAEEAGAGIAGALPRDGSAAMTGPLILPGNATLPLHAMPLQQAVGRLLNIRVFSTPTGSTPQEYFPTPGTKSIFVEAVGGGGQAGGTQATGAGQIAVPGAGGAGAYGACWVTSGFAGTLYMVGRRGLIAGPGNPGQDGDYTYFGLEDVPGYGGFCFLACPGGAGGRSGGVAGASGNYLNSTKDPLGPPYPQPTNLANVKLVKSIIGQPGSVPIWMSSGSNYGGYGGASPLGSGGTQTVPPGSGGGGYAPIVGSGSPALAGRAGGDGCIIVWEFT